MSSSLDQLHRYITDRYPQFRAGIEEAVAVSPHRFNEIAAMYLDWAVEARGPQAVQDSVDAYVQFTTDVNLAQARYERTGRYQHRSFAEVYADHYSQHDQMHGYLWGIYLANFLWSHHLEISLFFRDRFVSRLQEDAPIVEIAPGHGGWGVWALHETRGATLCGYDISPTSREIAESVARAAGVGDRCRYEQRDALDLTEIPPASADAAICAFLIEHLEAPDRLFAVIRHLLRGRGRAFVTGALTAAQVDHIYEFHHESELVQLAEAEGLRVVEMLSANPRRLLPKARYVPRSIALIVERLEDSAS